LLHIFKGSTGMGAKTARSGC